MGELHEKIGILLKLERHRQNLKLEDLAERLKISLRYLEEIEAGNVDALPSELYFNLFAKTYAEALGIDYSRTSEAIKEEVGEPLEAQNRDEKGRPSPETRAGMEMRTGAEQTRKQTRSGTRYLKTWVTVFGVIVVLFFIFLVASKFFFGSDDFGISPAEPEQADIVNHSTVDQSGSNQAEFAGYDWQVPEYQSASELQLKLMARGESWATVLADGDTVVFRNLTPGRTYNVAAKYRLLVSVAVPSVVDVELNGQAVNLRDSITRRISRVKINQLNVDSFLSGNQPDYPALSEPGGSQSQPNTGIDDKSVSDTQDDTSLIVGEEEHER